MARRDVIRRAWIEYHAGRITLTELMRIIADWRPHADRSTPPATLERNPAGPGRLL